jgi:hypothetical protein
MANNTEQIESRLAQYIDDQLDPAGCEEIERHLAANPSHRILLDEMRRQRKGLRELPREKAPADLMESLHGQIERDALLSGSQVQDQEITHDLSRWPQALVVGMVLLLAAGVGIAVYLMLPPDKPALIAQIPTTSVTVEQPALPPAPQPDDPTTAPASAPTEIPTTSPGLVLPSTQPIYPQPATAPALMPTPSTQAATQPAGS